MTKRAKDLKHLAELIELCLNDDNYRPSITTDAEMADAFDHAMKHVGLRNRAWRGGKTIDPRSICRCRHSGEFHRPTAYGTPCFIVGCACNEFVAVSKRTAALIARVAARAVAS